MLNKDVGKRELAVLAVIVALAREGEGRFDRYRDAVKLSKLLFLISHGIVDESGRVVGLRSVPRLDLDFVVYLFGVTSSDIYESIAVLEKCGLLRPISGSSGSYEVGIDLESVLNKLKEIDRELGDVAEKIIRRYSGMESSELTGLVNDLIGLVSPEVKAMFYGVSIRKLLTAVKEMRRLEEEGRVVDV